MSDTTAPPDPIFNIADLDYIDIGHGHEWPGAGQAHPKYQARMGMIAPKVGARHMGYNITLIAPGKRAFPLHNHRFFEEMFLVLEGHGHIRIGKDSAPRPIRPGDVIACPPGGPETAHQIINTGETEMKIFAVSAGSGAEICQYPDVGTFAVLSRDPPFRYIGKAENSLAYWQDEAD